MKYLLAVLMLIGVTQVLSNTIVVVDSANPLVVKGFGDINFSEVFSQLKSNADLFDLIINPITNNSYMPADSYMIDRIAMEEFRGVDGSEPWRLITDESGNDIYYNHDAINLWLRLGFDGLVNSPTRGIYFFMKPVGSGVSIGDSMLEWQESLV